MVAVQGYYDGTTIKLLEKITAKPNQRVIITIMDEFVEPVKAGERKGMRGALSCRSGTSGKGKKRVGTCYGR